VPRLRHELAFVRHRDDAIERGIAEQLLGHRLRERAELFVTRNEVRLAIQLDDRAGLRVFADERNDLALRGRAVGALLGLGNALLAKIFDGLVDVAAGLLECFLAIHHAGAGALAQHLDILRGNGRRSHISVLRFVETPPARRRGAL
jgi:hypothetical protein